jgi:uncharacterized membrane protein
VAKRDLARDAGKFAKHVLPAAIKPVHSLWHEVIGFIFLSFAGLGIWKIWHNANTLGPVGFVLLIPLILVLIGYGVSSFLKARRISRS